MTGRARASKIGRPRRGERHLFQSRVPTDLAETVKDAAEQRGLTYSDYIAVVLAEKHDYRLPDHYPVKRTDSDSVQEELQMQTAS